VVRGAVPVGTAKAKFLGCSHHCVTTDGKHEMSESTLIPYPGSFKASHGGKPSQIMDEHTVGADHAVVSGSQDVTRPTGGVGVVVGGVAMLESLL
jgi:hypothetical protein